jgi:hypothetical protein
MRHAGRHVRFSRTTKLTYGYITEVDRAIDNLVKSGKMFGVTGRRDSMPMSGAARSFPEQFGKANHRHHTIQRSLYI